MTARLHGQVVAIEVRPVADPLGRPSVLLQLPGVVVIGASQDAAGIAVVAGAVDLPADGALHHAVADYLVRAATAVEVASRAAQAGLN